MRVPGAADAEDVRPSARTAKYTSSQDANDTHKHANVKESSSSAGSASNRRSQLFGTSKKLVDADLPLPCAPNTPDKRGLLSAKIDDLLPANTDKRALLFGSKKADDTLAVTDSNGIPAVVSTPTVLPANTDKRALLFGSKKAEELATIPAPISIPFPAPAIPVPSTPTNSEKRSSLFGIKKFEDLAGNPRPVPISVATASTASASESPPSLSSRMDKGFEDQLLACKIFEDQLRTIVPPTTPGLKSAPPPPGIKSAPPPRPPPPGAKESDFDESLSSRNSPPISFFSTAITTPAPSMREEAAPVKKTLPTDVLLFLEGKGIEAGIYDAIFIKAGIRKASDFDDLDLQELEKLGVGYLDAKRIKKPTITNIDTPTQIDLNIQHNNSAEMSLSEGNSLVTQPWVNIPLANETITVNVPVLSSKVVVPMLPVQDYEPAVPSVNLSAFSETPQIEIVNNSISSNNDDQSVLSANVNETLNVSMHVHVNEPIVYIDEIKSVEIDELVFEKTDESILPVPMEEDEDSLL